MDIFKRFRKPAPAPAPARGPNPFNALNSLKNKHAMLKTQLYLAEKAVKEAYNSWNKATRNNSANVNSARAAYNAAKAASANAGRKFTATNVQLRSAMRNANKLMGPRR